MAITAAEQTSIVRLVVGMFNAAPGATYLNAISSVFEANGHNLSALATTLSNTGAFQSVYNTGLTSQQFATAFLTTLGLEDHQGAIDFIVAKANAGEDRGNIILDAINVLMSVTATSGEVADARDMLNNKVEVALFFSVDQNNPETDLAALQAVLSTITADHATVDAAIFGIENPPQSFNLTIGSDDFTGGAGNDTFTAGAALSTVDLILRPTLGGDDSLEGAGGFDVLDAVLNGQFGLAAGDDPHINDIEQINFQVRASGSLFDPDDNFAYVDFGNVTDVDEVNMVNSNDDSALVLFNVQEAVNLGASDQEGGYFDVDFDDDALGSAEASQLITVADVTEFEMNIDTDGDDAITDLTLMVEGGGSNDMELNVQDGEGNYTLLDLIIAGGGDLELRADDDFEELVTLNGTGLAGDLDIDISGGTNLESVLTGPGDDMVAVSRDLFDGDLDDDTDLDVTIDLGAGDNTLSMPGDFYNYDLDALDFSEAAISNVQTLLLDGYVQLDDDAALDVSTIGGLQTLEVGGEFFGDGYSLDLTGPAALDFNAEAFWNTNLITTGILDLSLNSSNGDVDLDSLTSEDITSLTVVADDGDEGDDADAWIDLDGADDNLVTLANISATADGNVHLELEGVEGEPEVPAEGGSVESGSFTLSGFDKNTGQFTGSVVLTSDDLPGGQLVIDVQGANNLGQVTDLVLAGLNAADGISAVEGAADEVVFTWDAVGDMDDISAAYVPAGDDGLNVGSVNIDQGTDPDVDAIPATPGTGFEGLTTVVVDAGGNGEVDMVNAMGAFSLVVTAGDDADVDLTDTGVTSIAATGDNVFIFVDGADGLTSVTATADDEADVSIEDAEALTSVTVVAGDDEGGNSLTLVNTDAVSLIDLTDITDNDDDELTGDAFIVVDVVAADFAGAVSILVGEENLEFSMDDGDAVRETFTFTADGTGAVTIDGFLASVGGTGDRLDFSQMAGIDNLDDLAITFDGTDTHITAAPGVDVDVDITVTGTDISLDAFHFVF